MVIHFFVGYIQFKFSSFAHFADFILGIYRIPILWYTAPMKVIRNLEISAGEFFGVVFEELVKEIQSVDKADVRASDLHEGFQYIAHAEDPALKVIFEVVAYQEDKHYKSVCTSANGTITVIYDVVPSEKGISVSFTYENTTPAGQKKKGFFGAFSEILFLSRMTDRLYDIQRTVINRKEGFTEWKSGSPLFPNIRKSI